MSLDIMLGIYVAAVVIFLGTITIAVWMDILK